jgi:single-strand DNA-binding protein
MPNLNKVMLMGNLTRDPEIKYTPKGTAVADISLAINRVWKNDAGQKQEDTTFVEVELWGRQAEIAGEYLKKGRPVYIEGRLKLDTWDDKQTGQKRSKMRVVGETLQLLGSRDGTNSGTSSGASERTQSRPPRPARPPADPDLDATDGDDVPF